MLTLPAAATATVPEHHRRFDDLAAAVNAYLRDADLDRLRRVYIYARDKHEGQTRKSGEPYIGHPVEVAHLVAELHGDQASVEAALLHDTIEDTSATADEIETLFGREVSELVQALTKLSKLTFRSKEAAQAENIRRLIVSMGRDVRVILVKLADRVHNMSTLQHKDEGGQKRIAQETLEIYAPIANRLGIHKMKVRLEDESFRYLDPDAYVMLKERVQKTRRERDFYVKDTIARLRALLAEHHIAGDVAGRSKHFYSIYQKMQRDGLDYDQVYDVTAFRVVVEDRARLYEVLGYVHSMWPPVAGRFKDYIAVPKANGYQSIHTTVIGPGGDRIEVQIRDVEMHQFAEFGVAAHWLYKERRRIDADAVDFTALRELMQTARIDDSTGKQYLDELKHGLFTDEVYVFTPQRDLKRLPRGSTPLDFAYAIHSEVGDHCMHARVNGRHVPLRYELANGDVVEIQTRGDQHPHESWLEMVRSPRAREKIRDYITREKKDQSRALARDLLTAEFARTTRRFETLEKSGDLLPVAESLKYQNVDQMMLAVGYGRLQPSSVVNRALQLLGATAEVAAVPAGPTQSTPTRGFGTAVRDLVLPTPSPRAVRVAGIDGEIMIAYARCCNPVPGEEILGYVTRGRGVVVHTRSCTRMSDLEPERLIDLAWDSLSTSGTDVATRRKVCVRIVCRDEPGLLAKMSSAFTEAGVNIVQAHCRARSDGKATNLFDVMVSNVRQLKEAFRLLRQIEGVMQVERVVA